MLLLLLTVQNHSCTGGVGLQWVALYTNLLESISNIEATIHTKY